MEAQEQVQTQTIEQPDFLSILVQMLDNPETREYAKKVLEYAGYQVPEPAYSKEINQAKEELLGKISAIEKELRKQKEQETANYVKGLLEKYGLDESHLPILQQLMIQRKIGDLETAIQYYSIYLVNARPNMGNPLKRIENNIERYKKHGLQALYEDFYQNFRL